MKNLYVLLERVGLEFVLDGTNPQMKTSTVLRKLLKYNTFKDISKLLFNKKQPNIIEFIKDIKTFLEENKRIEDLCMIVKDKMGGGGDKKVFTNNKYLEMIRIVESIGNYDCHSLNLDDALYILKEHNDEIKERNKKLKEK